MVSERKSVEWGNIANKGTEMPEDIQGIQILGIHIQGIPTPFD